LKINYLKKILNQIEKDISNQTDFVKNEIVRLGIKMDVDLDLKLVRIDNKYYSREICSNVIIGGPVL